jgi:hypothetical protein
MWLCQQAGIFYKHTSRNDGMRMKVSDSAVVQTSVSLAVTICTYNIYVNHWIKPRHIVACLCVCVSTFGGCPIINDFHLSTGIFNDWHFSADRYFRVKHTLIVHPRTKLKQISDISVIITMILLCLVVIRYIVPSGLPKVDNYQT